jgi:NAD(P)-dependent dehydrogenase (short-subunit alcohol dehydrogenase family)
MPALDPLKQFELKGQVAALTGAGGVLCSCMAKNLAAMGVKIAVLDILVDNAKKVADEINADGGEAIALKADVLSKSSMEEARDAIVEKFGTVDILINGAGGNKPGAVVTPDENPLADLPIDDFQWVFNLNFIGTFIPSQVFAKLFIEKGKGNILNLSSMSALQPLTKVAAYSAAKAAVSNFTQWLAVHFNQNYSPNIRVNALAPGFFLTEQNRYLLTDKETGEITQRGQQILDHTPQGRYGDPEDLVGATIWLLSPASKFVTGITLPVDGGFSAYCGV